MIPMTGAKIEKQLVSEIHQTRTVNDLPQFLQIMLLSFAAIKFSGHFGSRRRLRMDSNSARSKKSVR